MAFAAAFLMVINMGGPITEPPEIKAWFSDLDKCLMQADAMNNPPVTPKPPMDKEHPNGLIKDWKFAFCVKPVFPT